MGWLTKGAGIAVKGLGKAFTKGGGKPVVESLEQPFIKKWKANKKKKIMKENMKVAGVGAGMAGATAAYVGYEYGENLKKYPQTGKNLKKSK